MLLGALLDAGVDADALIAELRNLNIDGWTLRTERVTRSGIAATKAHVEITDAAQPERRLSDIVALLDASALPPTDRERASSIFRRLADAEAQVHGVAPEEIAFHEVGALDAIVDVAGGVIALRLLGIDRLYCSPLPAAWAMPTTG